MLVSTISPAPSRSTSRAQATASSPVPRRPPWVWTSHTSRPSLLHPLRVDIDHDALAAEPPGGLVGRTPGFCGAAVLIDTLSQPASSRSRISFERADAAPHGQRHEDHLGRPPDDVQHDLAPLVAGRDVQKHQLVGPFRLIAGGHLRPGRRRRAGSQSSSL